MKTMDGQQVEIGNSKMVKSVAASVGGGSVKWLDEIQIIIINTLIDDCSNSIINEEDSSDLLKKLVDKLRESFESDYCSIGKVDGDYVEDYIISWANRENENEFRIQERDLKSVNRVSLQNQKCCVCRGLKSKELYTYFDIDEIKGTDNYHVYEFVLGEVSNTTIIPIRNNKHENKGFIQLINSKSQVNKYDIISLRNSLLRLITLIHQRDGLKDAILFKKDYTFISNVQQKINDVDSLLEDIMKYLSDEFSAGVVSYRIPILVGAESKPLFFLRDCYINEEITQYYSKHDYFRDRLVKIDHQMGGFENLGCKKIKPVIKDRAKDSDYYKRILNEKICFRDDTLIIPILRDYSEKDKCFHPNKKDKRHSCDNEADCPYRFAKYFGVFKLRILKNPDTSLTDREEVNEWLSDETNKRLSNLAKHISILLNAIVDKYENKSLDMFQEELKGTSFTRIKEFDEQCSKIVKKAIHTSNCAIYRYKNDKLIYSASSDSISTDFNEIIDKYGEPSEELVKTIFAKKKPVYFVKNDKEKFNSILIVPMIRKNKNNSKLGFMLLVGKDTNKMGNLSKTFWEHDKKHIEFIVDVLTRIEESDSERLTFLSQLSHELLQPVTKLVYRNDYNISIATRNPEVYPKKNFIKEMQKNADMCMMFKYIIADAEYIYSLSKGDVKYIFEMTDFKSIILNAIRFFEEDDAANKQLTIKTYLKNMPEKMWIDKSRMMQVVINLLKNAIQYSRSNEEISISYEYNEKAKCHEINFSDNGIPVHPKEKEVIFDMFFRSKQAVEKRPNGTGIGLYLVKQIMIAHEGDCYVKELSFPTIFTLQIPNKNKQS